MKLTLVPLPLLLAPLSLSMASPAKPATWEAELPPVPGVRSAAGAMAPPVEVPATVGPAVVLPAPAPAGGPAAEPELCGVAAAVCGAEVELSLLALDDVLTEVELGVVGEVVLLTSVVTVA